LATASQAAELIARLAGRAAAGGEDAAETEAAVRDILRAVRERGLAAVVEYTRAFDCPAFSADMFAVRPELMREAAQGIPDQDRSVIREAAGRIRRFHEAQKEKNWFITDPHGAVLGQMVTPLDRVGLYVPGGKGGDTPLISSLLMNAIPAQVAGVDEIAVVSPPGPGGSVNAHILAAAHELGIAEVYACGSAWAVAALAFGAGSLAPVDLVAGPGNIWVTTAKKLLLGKIGIDILAGPSEICVIADGTADPAWVAADMLSQAEHDPLAAAVCVTDSTRLAQAVQSEMERQTASLPRADIARASLRDWGAIVIVPDMALAVKLSNRVAPEHLEVCVADPWALLGSIRHAGSIFLGNHSPEPLGDYFAGPNHVLPTLGTARFSSGLSVHTFCKRSNIIAASRTFADRATGAVARLARLEGLEAHARSLEIRNEQPETSWK
jgi:histidinol dehydrogenase